MAPLALAKDPPLFLKPLLPFEEYTTVRITYTHTVPAVAGPPAVASYDITRKRDVPFCPDSSDKERLLRVIDEYLETCPDNILHIHDADRYENFRQIIGGSMKTVWTQIVSEDRPNPAQRTDHNFLIDVRTFVRRHCPSNAADLFKTYLADPKTVKPHDFDCYETRSRLELLNKLSRFLPGAGGDPIFNTDLSLRNAFFQLMLDPWQLKFTENGNSTEAPMTIDRMVNFFEQQRIHYNARQASPRRSRGNYSGRPYDHRPFPYRFNPGRGGYDQRLGNQYRNNSPNRFGRGGGGGRSPGGRAPYIHPDSTPHELLTLLAASLVVVDKREVVLVAVAFANLVVDCVPTPPNNSWDSSNNRITFTATCHPRLTHILHHVMMNRLMTISSPATPPNLWLSLTHTTIIQKTTTTLTTIKSTLINILPHRTTLPMTIPITLTLTLMTTDPSAPPLSPYMIVLLTPEISTLHILTLSP